MRSFLAEAITAFRTAGVLLLTWAGASAQLLVPPDRIAETIKEFDSAAKVSQSRCSIAPVHPVLGYDLRLRTGFVADVPLKHLEGTRHELGIVTRVTPENGEPRYLKATGRIPEVSAAHTEGEIRGAFVVGEGVYTVETLVRDDSRQLCRSKWRIEARRSPAERDLKPMTPPGAVEELAAGTAAVPEPKADSKTGRLTILLHAAPLLPRLSKLLPGDVSMLAESLSSLLAQLAARPVRLVVFNLESQQVILREDNFGVAGLDKVEATLRDLDLGKVNYQVLQNRSGPVDLLMDLLRRELQGADAPDAVVLLGPLARLLGDLPPQIAGVETPAARRLFYVQFRPGTRIPQPGPYGLRRRGAPVYPDAQRWPNRPGAGDGSIDSGLPDSIERLIGHWRGETMAVRTPHDLAGAIAHMAAQVRGTSDAGQVGASGK